MLIKYLVESVQVALPMICICPHKLFIAVPLNSTLNMEHLPKLDLPILCHLPVTTLPLCQPQTLDRLGIRPMKRGWGE